MEQSFDFKFGFRCVRLSKDLFVKQTIAELTREACARWEIDGPVQFQWRWKQSDQSRELLRDADLKLLLSEISKDRADLVISVYTVWKVPELTLVMQCIFFVAFLVAMFLLPETAFDIVLRGAMGLGGFVACYYYIERKLPPILQ